MIDGKNLNSNVRMINWWSFKISRGGIMCICEYQQTEKQQRF